MIDRYKTWQYTKNTVRVVIENKAPMSLGEMMFILKDILTLTDRTGWEPVQNEDLGAVVMPSKHVCDELCAGSCPDEHKETIVYCAHCGAVSDQPNFGYCKECELELRADQMRDEQDNFDRFGGDPNDEATWIGHEPDRRPQV